MLHPFIIDVISYQVKLLVLYSVLGVGTGKNVENHVQENVGWILFKTHDICIYM